MACSREVLRNQHAADPRKNLRSRFSAERGQILATFQRPERQLECGSSNPARSASYSADLGTFEASARKRSFLRALNPASLVTTKRHGKGCPRSAGSNCEVVHVGPGQRAVPEAGKLA